MSSPEVIAGIVIGSIALLGLTSYGLSGSHGSSKNKADADDGDDAVSEIIEDEVSSISDATALSGIPKLDEVFPLTNDFKGRNLMYTPSGKPKTGKKGVEIVLEKNKTLEIPPEGNSNPVIRKSTTRKSNPSGGKKKSRKSRKSKKSKKSKKSRKSKKRD